MKIPITTVEEFKTFVEVITSQSQYKAPLAFGVARVDLGQLNPEKSLQATYPVVNWSENFGSAAIFISALQAQGIDVDFTKNEVVYDINLDFIEYCLNAFNPFLDEAIGSAHKNIQVISAIKEQMLTGFVEQGEFKVCFIFEDTPLESVEATYLKLYALSTGKVDLRSINLNGAFGALPNVAWSEGIPIELDWLRENEIMLKVMGEYPHIDFVDKFPRFLQHIIPADNTRILDTSKVRFGAQLAAGTTVMPGASYINFNAGTTGSVMVEGRISSSAIVGANSDVGGGASILGVLSGTDGNPISIGENCLLGANSVCGIPLGDACIIDAGLAILEGTKIIITEQELEKLHEVNPDWIPVDQFLNEEEELEKIDPEDIDPEDIFYVFKGSELQNLNGLHFRQNSLAGEIICKRSTKEVKLNEELHQ